MDAATIISAVITQTGTDASRPTILQILNERYLEQVAKSQWLLMEVALNNLGVDPARWEFPALPEIVEVIGVKVNGYPWDRIGQEEMWELQAGSLTTTAGRGGVFAPDYTNIGTTSVILYPAPGGSTVSILSTAAVLPPALADNTGNIPATPTDTHGTLIDGASSMVLRRIDERSDLAAPFETTFQTSIEDLRKRKNRLVRGRGPTQIQVAGYHFSMR